MDSAAPASRSKPPATRLLVVDDDASVRSALATLLRQEHFEVATAEDGASALVHLRRGDTDVLVSDIHMPGMDGLELLRKARELRPDLIVVIMTAHATVETAVQAMREGAEDYLTKPVQVDELLIVLERALEKRRLRKEATAMRAQLSDRVKTTRVVATSPAMKAVFATVEQVAPSRANVLITGESGTGKEVVAEAIHQKSPRAAAPFVKLHCAALAETILESELFGHEKGAFTGSVGRREGRFKQADGGTLLLDEIGDISPTTQVKLLRFLQERTFERVGGNETLKVDVRIIAATNRDLSADVAAGRFREDLYYRLNVVNIETPPLRARPEDVLPLANHFVERFARENGKTILGFDEAATERIKAYRWPGNVRELENVVERAVVLCDEPRIASKHLPAGVGGATRGTVRIPGSTLAEIEKYAILSTLEAVEGRTAQAANMLEVSLRKVQYKVREYSGTTKPGETEEDGGDHEG